jgi:hypothetical protein
MLCKFIVPAGLLRAEPSGTIPVHTAFGNWRFAIAHYAAVEEF